MDGTLRLRVGAIGLAIGLVATLLSGPVAAVDVGPMEPVCVPSGCVSATKSTAADCTLEVCVELEFSSTCIEGKACAVSAYGDHYALNEWVSGELYVNGGLVDTCSDNVIADRIDYVIDKIPVWTTSNDPGFGLSSCDTGWSNGDAPDGSYRCHTATAVSSSVHSASADAKNALC